MYQPLEIFGDGLGNLSDDTGTTIRPYYQPAPGFTSDNVFVISPHVGSFVYIHDLKIRGLVLPHTDLTKAAIYCYSKNALTDTLRFERIAIVNTSGHGIYLDADVDSATSTGSINTVSIRDCHAIGNHGTGILLQDVTLGYLVGVIANDNQQAGLVASRAQDIRIIGNTFTNNQAGTSTSGSASTGAQVYLSNCASFLVSGCAVSRFDEAPNSKHTALLINGSFGGYVEGCAFENTLVGGTSDSRSIVICEESSYLNPPSYLGSVAVRIGSNVHSSVAIPVEVLSQQSARRPCVNCIIMPQTIRNAPAAAPSPKIIIPDIDDGGDYGFTPSTYSSNLGVGLLLPRVSALTRAGIPTDPVTPNASILRRGLILYQGAPAGGLPGESADRLNVYSGIDAIAPLRGFGWQSLIPKVGTDQDLIAQSGDISRDLLTKCPQGPYRVTVVQTCSAVSASKPIITTYLTWTDRAGGARVLALGGQLFLTQVGAITKGVALIEVGEGSPLSYQTVVTGDPIASGTFDLRIRLEAL